MTNNFLPILARIIKKAIVRGQQLLPAAGKNKRNKTDINEATTELGEDECSVDVAGAKKNVKRPTMSGYMFPNMRAQHTSGGGRVDATVVLTKYR